ERDRPYALLPATARPLVTGDSAKEPQRLLPCSRKRGERRGQIQFHVLPLTGGALAIEVREERIFLREQPADALAEPLAFQVSQVPDMLDQRERAAAHAHERLRHLRRDPRDDRGRPLQHLADLHAPGIYHRRPQGVPSSL